MKPLFQLSTRNYEKEIPLVRKAMVELEGICKIQNGYILGEPDSKAGWTFFTVEISPEMSLHLEKSGMMVGARGLRVAEQMTNFLGQFLFLRGSNVRIKKINY